MKKQFTKIIIYLFLLTILITTILPLFYTFIASFKSNKDILTGNGLFRGNIIFDNYRQAWEIADFKTYTFNSVYMTFFIVVGVLINTTMGGYVFSRGTFPFKKIIFSIFISTMFVSMGSLTLYPLLDIAKFFGLNKSLWGVIIINVFGLNITSILLVKSYLDTIPKEIDEAAKIDGCSVGGIFYHILLPLMKPIIATIGILTFRNAWNDYLLPMVFTISSPKNAPLVVGVVALKSTGEAASSWNLMLAGTMISIIPMIIAYLSLNRYFVAGLTSGAVKG